MGNIFNDARTTLAEVVLVANGEDPLTGNPKNYIFVEFTDDHGKKARGHESYPFGKSCSLSPGDEVSIAYVTKKPLDVPGGELLDDASEPMMEASTELLKGMLGGLGAKAARKSVENAQKERKLETRKFVTYDVMILNLDRYLS